MTKKLNFMITHRMLGAKHQALTCTCGHKQKFEIGTAVHRCPICDAPNVHQFPELFYGKQPVNYLRIIKKNNSDKIYDFSVEFYLYNFNSTIDFEKQEVNIEDIVEYKWLIHFNKNESEMLKVFQIIDNKECRIRIENLYDKIMLKMAPNAEFYSLTETEGKIKADAFSKAYYGYGKYEIIKNIISSAELCEIHCRDYEQLVKSEIDMYDYRSSVNRTKTTPAEQLGVSPAIFKKMTQFPSSYYDNIIYIHKQFGDQALNFIDIFKDKRQFAFQAYQCNKIYRLMSVGKISLKKIYKYLFEDAPRKQGIYAPERTLELLYDSFEMVQSLKIDFIKSPQALMRYHDVLTREYDMVKDEIKNQEFVNVMEEYKSYEYMSKITEEEILSKEENGHVINKYLDKPKSTNKYNMILPKDIDDLVREGNDMHHCVGGYVDRILRRESVVLFLRKAEEPDKSYATIELRPTTNKIQQVRCVSNSRLNDKKALEFIKKWCVKNNVTWNGHSYY